MIAAEKLLKSKLNKVCGVKTELNMPQIKIIGKTNTKNMNEQAFEEDINTKNFGISVLGGKMIHMYTVKEKISQHSFWRYQLIFKLIRGNNNQIFVGYLRCKV